MDTCVLKSTGIAGRTQLHLVAVLVGLAAASSPVAASVIYTSSNSSLTAGPSGNQQQVTASDFTTFSQSLGVQGSTAYASQTAQLGPGGISVTMHALQYGYSDFANSTLSVGFTLDTPMKFQLTGYATYLFSSGDGRIDFSGPCFYCETTIPNGAWNQLYVNDPNFFTSNILQPGAYTLFVEALASGAPYMSDSPESYVTANLSLTPVPLPSAILLLVSGLGAMSGRALRRARGTSDK
jgi:hypothetical protein